MESPREIADIIKDTYEFRAHASVIGGPADIKRNKKYCFKNNVELISDLELKVDRRFNLPSKLDEFMLKVYKVLQAYKEIGSTTSDVNKDLEDRVELLEEQVAMLMAALNVKQKD